MYVKFTGHKWSSEKNWVHFYHLDGVGGRKSKEKRRGLLVGMYAPGFLWSWSPDRPVTCGSLSARPLCLD